MDKRYHVINYGCQLNFSDGEHYAGQLEKMGYSRAESPKDADVVVVNTCCVRETAEKKILGKIGELKQVKKLHPGQIICVAGCMAQKDGAALARKYPQIDLLLGTGYVNSFEKILQDFLSQRNKGVFMEIDESASEFEGQCVRQSGFSAWIPIMYGCNNFCSYCIVPYVRGRERSREKDNIIAEIKGAVARGYSEITLLGQNVNSYGNDLGKKDAFADLLAEADQVEGIKRIHFMTSHPKDMSLKVIDTVARGTHLCENFHVALQSGSDRILAAMNRRYTRDHFLGLVSAIRERIPDAAITTDVIVGFPGETEEDFEATLDMMRQARFDSAYTFIYSKRSGTPAANMKEQVDDEIKHQRLERLMEVQNQISLEKNEALVGKTMEVIVEGPTEKNPDVMSGRTRTNKIVLWQKAGDLKAGDLADIRITQAQTWLLKGEREI